MGVKKLGEDMSFTWDTKISITAQLNPHSPTYIVWTNQNIYKLKIKKYCSTSILMKVYSFHT